MDNGGPAFPRTGEGFGDPRYEAVGMSLRDYFAAAALTGLCSAMPDLAPHLPEGNKQQDNFANMAFALADAMLAERAKGRT